MPLEKLNNYDIILASKSPRRQQLLTDLGISFRVETADTPENFPEEMERDEIPVYLAEIKAKVFEENLRENQIIITADTIVWLDGKVLNKPENYTEGFSMLKSLSGKKHQVLTGVCLLSMSKKLSFVVSTDVWFKNLTDSEINYYLENYKPFDKAGGYGIQEWIGYIGINRIEGSYFNVMGLPVSELYLELLSFIDL